MITVIAFLVGVSLGAFILYWVSQKTIEAQRKQLEQNHRLVEEIEQSHEVRLSDTLEVLKREHWKELTQQRQPLDKRIEELQQKHQESLNDLAQDHWSTLEAFQTERYLEITNLKNAHQEEIATLNAEIVTLKTKFQTDMKSIQQQFQKKLENEVESARSQFQVVVDKFISDHNAEIEQLKNSHRQEIDALTTSVSNASANDVNMNDTSKQATITNGIQRNTGTQIGSDHTQIGSDQKLNPQELQADFASAASDIAFEAPTSSIPETDSISSSTEVASSPEVSPFIATIRMMGRSKRVSAIAQLSKQVAQADAEGRQAIAQSLYQIVRANPQSPALQDTISPLTKLSQDLKPTVRQVAIEALGNIPSAKAVPIVKRALRDPDAKVIKAANQAMEKLKPFAKSSQVQRLVSLS
ncbi:MAG: HEAT repeat domain-containing protein [Cyanobacteria bacterium P01_F01_bin.150]